MEAHAEYVDGVLPMVRMRSFDAHAGSCRGCGDYDRVVRRSLLLARNLPEIQPSAHFHESLQARLMGVDAEASRSMTANNATVVVIAAVLALVAITPLLRLVPEPTQPAPTVVADPIPISPFAPGDLSPVSATILVRSPSNADFTPVIVQPPALQAAPSGPRLISYPLRQAEDR